MAKRGPKERVWPDDLVREIQADFEKGTTFDQIMERYQIPSKWYVRKMVRPVMLRMLKEIDDL